MKYFKFYTDTQRNLNCMHAQISALIEFILQMKLNLP